MSPEDKVQVLIEVLSALDNAISCLEDIEPDEDGDDDPKAVEFHWSIQDLKDDIKKYIEYLQ